MARTVDGRPKARGEAEFVADAVEQPRLFGALLTTRTAHCRVTVDLDALRALPGVVVALDHDSVPATLYSTNPHGGSADTSVFTDIGRYPGDIVGALAARDRRSLQHALDQSAELITEQPLPAVLSLEDAFTANAEANPQYPGNVVSDLRIGADEAAAREALAACAYQHTSTTWFEPSPHGCLERLAAGAERGQDGWRVWSPSQCPALVRDLLADMFAADVRLEPVFVGGGFGGKEELTLEPAAMLLSAAAGGTRVLLESSRRQMTAAHRARHGGYIRVSTGYDRDGIFGARLVDVVFEAGPYDGHSSTVAANAANAAARLYPRGTVTARSRAMATNRLPGGAFRGYGSIQATFAVETHVDEIAARLGLDRFEIRRRNLARAGDVDPATGLPMHDIDAIGCLDQLARTARTVIATRASGEPSEGLDGWGISMLVSTSAAAGADKPDHAEVACRLEPGSGTVIVETSVAEAGQGIYPLLNRIAANALGLDRDRVLVEHDVRAGSPNDPGMFGSRGANVTGSAVLRASMALRREVLARGARLLAVAPDVVELDAEWTVIRDGQHEVKVSELDPIRVCAEYATTDPGLAFGAQLAQVRCDPRTGAVRVQRVVAVHDAGVVLDEDGARAQVEGAVVQGIGAALSERATFRPDGSIAESGFVNHLVPTAVGLPAVSVSFLPAAASTGSTTGAKGIGEAAIMGIAAAIGNAVGSALGVRARELPITGERVLRLLENTTRDASRSDDERVAAS
ncbi:MAG: hypothetical protein JWO57_1371 [Pseudonocardiales bacterium]|nr:hypothetical protein [Pseudonocardiales bacterium]